MKSHKMFKPALLLCFAALSFTNCSKDNASMSNSPSASASSANVTESVNEPTGYVLMGNKVNSKLNQIRQKNAELGATETGYIAKINQMYVSSTNPNFTSTMEALGVTVGIDFKITNIDPPSRSIFGNVPVLNPVTGNNPLFQLQWNMHAISAPQAWTAGYKGRGVRVAVLDGGMYLDHPDLKDNINKSLCRNFVTLPGENNPLDASFTRAPEFSHATHVAGIIAAADNSIGVIGVAPEAEIIAVKVLNDQGDGSASWAMQGIIYATDNGAKVINMSFGSAVLKGSGQDQAYHQAVINTMYGYKDAIQYANSKGVTVISGAGNDALDFDHTGSVEFFPAASPFSICISATAPESWYDKMIQGTSVNLDNPASYTNFGSSRIDFAAPGGDCVSSSNNWFYDMVYSTAYPTGYEYALGTSMATPHVSGIAALIIGKNGGSMDPAKVKMALKKSADDLGKPGNDPYFGDGRVNAFKAIQ